MSDEGDQPKDSMIERVILGTGLGDSVRPETNAAYARLVTVLAISLPRRCPHGIDRLSKVIVERQTVRAERLATGIIFERAHLASDQSVGDWSTRRT
jgi:hypothetical protein